MKKYIKRKKYVAGQASTTATKAVQRKNNGDCRNKRILAETISKAKLELKKPQTPHFSPE